MITDNFLRLSGSLTTGSAAGQAVTGTANSTNIVDLSLARDIGEGEDLYVQFTVMTTFTSQNNASTLTPTIVVSAAENLSTPTTIATAGTIALGSLVAGSTPSIPGYSFAVRLNPQIASLGLRYLGAIYTVGTANFSAGAITADIVTNIQDGKKFYESGFSVT